jgi:hypothetical protein
MILWGADTLAWTEARFSEYVFAAWGRDESSLLRPLPAGREPLSAAGSPDSYDAISA